MLSDRNFWQHLDELIQTSEMVIDRPKGSARIYSPIRENPPKIKPQRTQRAQRETKNV